MIVGREAELARIEALLAAARGGRGDALVIRGEPGLGKTALLEQARRRAHGLAVLAARGIEAESELSFAGLLDLLEPLLDRAETLPRPQADALAGALGLGPARVGDRFAVCAASLALLRRAASEQPLLVLVDDAHWLDSPTLEVCCSAPVGTLPASRS